MNVLGTGPVLFGYVAMTFVRWIGGVFLLGAAIIFLADAVELVRRTVDRDTFDAGTAVLASLLKTPALGEEFLPFAVLFGAIAAFLALNRRLELAVMRGAGISAWQFVAPALAVALAVGVLATTLYNPLSANAREASDALAARVLGKDALSLTGGGETVWFRQEGAEGSSIMHASAASSDGLTLYRVEAHLFDEAHRFAGRLQAETAVLGDGAWTLVDVVRYDAGGAREYLSSARLPTLLSRAEVREAVARPDAIAFWNLPDAVALAERAGLPGHRFAMQYHLLLARPLLLAAMVLIAASVSLRLVRLGGVARAATGGVVAGFVLYVASAVASDLGEAGAVPPILAAWMPGVAATLFGTTALLFSEDG